LLALSRFATLTFFFSVFLFFSLSLSEDFERGLTRLLSTSQEYKLMKKKTAEMKALEELAKKQQQDAA
jgi:hypothetical protein